MGASSSALLASALAPPPTAAAATPRNARIQKAKLLQLIALIPPHRLATTTTTLPPPGNNNDNNNGAVEEEASGEQLLERLQRHVQSLPFSTLSRTDILASLESWPSAAVHALSGVAQAAMSQAARTSVSVPASGGAGGDDGRSSPPPADTFRLLRRRLEALLADHTRRSWTRRGDEHNCRRCDATFFRHRQRHRCHSCGGVHCK
jgi:hypothetical protein